MPTMRAKAKSLSDPEPKMKSRTTGISVTRDVLSDRVMVSASDSFTILLAVILRRIGTFSRTRSKTITVSYIEYPSTVRTAATVSAVTVLPEMAYTPTVIRMSWASATMTGTAYFHSNRNET